MHSFLITIPLLFQTVPICRLGLRDTFLRPTDFVFSLKLLEKEAVSAILCGISVLELCLVIAMKHVQDISEDEPFNFEMVYSGELLRHGHSCTLSQCVHFIDINFANGIQ